MANLKKSDNHDYSYYSKKLSKAFDTLDELREAERIDAEIKAEKESAAMEKKQSAKQVENAYKALNAAKKEYKEKLQAATLKHANAMKQLQEEFTKEKAEISKKFEDAELNYKNELNAFIEKHPEGFHLTLKDGDYETSISSARTDPLDMPAFGDWFISTFFNL